MKGIFYVYDGSKVELNRISVSKLPYKRDKIVDYCVQEFSDDDPCIIHETFSKNAFALKIMNMLDKMDCGNECIFAIENCPAFISELVSFPENVKSIKII